MIQKPRSVFINYYFFSQELGYDSTCTLRGPRKAGAQLALKSERELKKEGRGAMDFVQSNGVLVVHWLDKKLVSVASTVFSAKPATKAYDTCFYQFFL